MKFKDITYVLKDKAIMPEVMGAVAVNLYDWSIPFAYYEETIPEVEKIMEICKNFKVDDEFENIISKEEAPFGFYKKCVNFFIIETLEETNITYFPRADSEDNRHWINGELAFIGNPHTVYTITLKKGFNIFCFEHAVCSIPYVRIERTDKPDNAIVSLAQKNYWRKAGDFIIKCKSEFIQDDNIFEFSLIPIDLVNLSYNSKIKMIIKLENNGPILYEIDANFKTQYKFDLSFIPNMHEDEYERLFVYFYAAGKCGKIFEKYIIIHRYDPKPEYTEKIKEQVMQLLEYDQISTLIKNEIHYCLNNMCGTDKDHYYGRKLKNIIEAYSENTLHEYLYKPGDHYIYYYCKEDDNYYYYYLVLPKDFDKSKEYPLLLNFSHGHVDNFSDIHYSSNYTSHYANREGSIYADIGGRGCTLGSYTGEVFLLYEINHLLENFPINKRRIYASAHCAGNTAIFNFAQTYPHILAGIYTRYGNIYEPNINNLYNIPCMYLLTDKDETVADPLQFRRKEIEKKLRKFNYLYMPKFNIDELQYAQFTESAINMLMSKDLDEYPEIIYYRTERNRSRRAYYIEIESIEEGKDFAQFNSEIVEYNLVIEVKNCTGLKITLPPQIDKDSFYIKINNTIMNFKNYDKNEIFLKISGNNYFQMTDSLDDDICYYKGTGLLDVYFSPMRIINCNPQNSILTHVASVFSNPKTNTAYTYIHANYPIKSMKDIDSFTDFALIIIDNNCCLNEKLSYIYKLLPIQMNDTGYIYKGIAVECKYCIMQVITNPWSSNKSILYINANDENLYNKNLFTRKLLMPTYGNGYHPYLNGVALLFDGDKYYSIREWNEDFFEV